MDLKERKTIYEQGFQLSSTIFGDSKLAYPKDWYHIYKLYVDDKIVSKEIVDYYNLKRYGIEEITNAHWYSMIANIWLMTESPSKHILDSFYTLMRPSPYYAEEDPAIICRDSDMNFMMSNDELEVFNNLPNKFKVYRGITETDMENIAYDEGFSWTLLEEKAKWFSTRFAKNKKPKVLELEVYKDTPYPTKKGDKPKAVAYLNRRKEKEIIVYNYSSSEFITMPPWDHSIHHEFFIEEMLIDTYLTHKDWEKHGFNEPQKEFSKRSRLGDWDIGNDETISWDRYEYHNYLLFEYSRRGIKFDDLPIDIAKKERADKLFIKDMEHRKTKILKERDL